MRLALKVDVDTLRGTVEGVPNLVRMMGRHGVNATFLFSLGPDHTGRALRRIFRPGFLEKSDAHLSRGQLRAQDVVLWHAASWAGHWAKDGPYHA